MKKFVNDPKKFVPEMLQGIALANPDTLRYVPEYNLIMRADAPRDDKVSIIQGSGSGHEPAHVMIVGKGMLDAACPGDVFAAPPMDYVYETTKLLASPKGVLLLVNNYTGDRMAFDMGQEMAEAEGVNVETLIIDDDVAVKDSTYTVGRRGVAGNFFVIKAVGAAAEQGADLDELVAHRREGQLRHPDDGHGAHRVHAARQGLPAVRARRRRDGDGRRHPRRARPPPREAGQRRRDRRRAARGGASPTCRTQQGDDVALMINGLGGTPISELYILYGRAHEQLADRGITVRADYVGEYCTSLDMAGASLTLVKLDDEIDRLLAAPAEIAIRIF